MSDKIPGPFHMNYNTKIDELTFVLSDAMHRANLAGSLHGQIAKLLEEASTEYYRLAEDRNNWADDATKKRDQIFTLTRDLQNTKACNDFNSTRVGELQKDFQDLAANHNFNKSLIKALQTDLTRLQRAGEERDGAVRELDKARGEVARLQSQLARYTKPAEINDGLYRQIEDQKHTILGLKDDLDDYNELEAELNQLKDLNTVQKGLIGEQCKEIKKLQSKENEAHTACKNQRDTIQGFQRLTGFIHPNDYTPPEISYVNVGNTIPIGAPVYFAAIGMSIPVEEHRALMGESARLLKTAEDVASERLVSIRKANQRIQDLQELILHTSRKAKDL